MSVEAPPVAVDFLERLVFDSDPGEAIQTLSSIWRVRADASHSQFGLSHAEYLVQLCLIYTGEVGNGGHAQFFMNRDGRLIADTLEALVDVGIPELAQTLSDATFEFPGREVPADAE